MKVETLKAQMWVRKIKCVTEKYVGSVWTGCVWLRTHGDADDVFVGNVG
jgi:hypothetical protein